MTHDKPRRPERADADAVATQAGLGNPAGETTSEPLRAYVEAELEHDVENPDRSAKRDPKP